MPYDNTELPFGPGVRAVRHLLEDATKQTEMLQFDRDKSFVHHTTWLDRRVMEAERESRYENKHGGERKTGLFPLAKIEHKAAPYKRHRPKTIMEIDGATKRGTNPLYTPKNINWE